MEKAQQPSTLNAQPSTLTSFVINDNTIYTSPADFKAMGNAERYQQLLIMRNQLETIRKELQSARIQYANATASQRESLGNEILTAEKNVSQLETNILLMEQDIRNSENQLIQ
jgi:multidrug resistance efflux pump